MSARSVRFQLRPKRTNKAIGRRIYKLRTSLGLSQRDLGLKGSTYAYISRIEAGSRNASWNALAEIGSRLGTTGLYLLTGKHDAVCPFCGRKDAQTECDGNGRKPSLLINAEDHS